ncbi:MAG: hypothetical protein Ta2D_06300 [Rickettsiales bacterium]|nr:MAG: hypothetical protein Ta2D_06300 [Rickettsiales bacterium]
MKTLLFYFICVNFVFASSIQEIRDFNKKEKDKVKESGVVDVKKFGTDEKDEVKKYYQDEKIKLQTTYSNGKPENISEYINGKKEGKDQWFYSNGKKKYDTPYKNDKKNGEEIVYYEDGTTIKEKNIYQDDKLIEKVLYYPSGTKEAEISDKKEKWWFEDGNVDKEQEKIKVKTDNSDFIVPLNNATTSSVFGERSDPIYFFKKQHKGKDYSAPYGTPIFATADGMVQFAGWNNGGYGNLVTIKHKDGFLSKYAHQSRILTKIGKPIKQGEIIGYVGSTGKSTGNHLHFEILKNNVVINPDKVLTLPKSDKTYK